MSKYIVTCDDETASWIGNEVDSMEPIVERTCTFEPESFGLLGQYRCSVCNDTVRIASLKVLERLHYCPNCGSKVVSE